MTFTTRTRSKARYAVLGAPEEVEREVAALLAAGAWEVDRLLLRDGRLLVQLASGG